VAAGALACGEDRPRPGPPVLSIHFQHDTVNTPDTLRGTIKAVDNEGIDSLWMQVGVQPQVGVNGGFQFTFEAPFLFFIDSGLSPGVKISVEVRGRDIAGYMDVLDTFVVIKK
jgi:hypothetical protein